MLAGNNVFGFWPVVISLTGASPSFASIVNQTPWRSEKLSARSLRIVFKIERKKPSRHERLREFNQAAPPLRSDGMLDPFAALIKEQ